MGKISDELRRWCDLCCHSYASASDCDELRALADRIDAEMVELPRDRDGEIIHVGDTVYLEGGRKAEVSYINLGQKKTSILAKSTAMHGPLIWETCQRYSKTLRTMLGLTASFMLMRFSTALQTLLTRRAVWTR